jgi:hypothetical protein
LVRAEADAFPQRQGDIRQFFARRRWRSRRMTACENLEFAGLQFQYHGTCDSTGVVVDAKDETARPFYKKYGFIELPKIDKRLLLPMATIEQLFRKK